ncbi:MAG: iron dependent repressor, metal binding and dimerization domain protein [Nitrosomonadaceae bacterium]
MITQLTSLVLTGLGVAIVAFIFWPKSGIFWKWQRGMHSTQRVLIEDALKHLYDQEYKESKCTLQSIAGTLSITGDQAAKLMGRLESLGSVKSQDEGFQLTAQGRSYALRIIRIHRLWERYLADETGLSETEWHRQAEKQEHIITTAEADKLAAQMGNPSYDPHGDPIPTASGKLPPKRGKALTDLAEGEFGSIIHMEDEPSTIFAQLVAEGLHPGMQLRMLEKTPKRIYFIADDEEIVLAPVVAANVTVAPLPREHMMDGPHDSLASLSIGEKGKVISISKGCRAQQRRRLMDLGVIPGTVITAKMRSASGDPTAYDIRGATIGLRKKQAEMIYIRRMEETTS